MRGSLFTVLCISTLFSSTVDGKTAFYKNPWHKVRRSLGRSTPGMQKKRKITNVSSKSYHIDHYDLHWFDSLVKHDIISPTRPSPVSRPVNYPRSVRNDVISIRFSYRDVISMWNKLLNALCYSMLTIPLQQRPTDLSFSNIGSTMNG